MQQLRDSVYTGAATANGREEMRWLEGPEGMRLLLYPPWWPVGVVVTFDRRVDPLLGAADTLAGTAVALVADAARPSPRASARVVRARC
jgi:hypothetical protein